MLVCLGAQLKLTSQRSSGSDRAVQTRSLDSYIVVTYLSGLGHVVYSFKSSVGQGSCVFDIHGDSRVYADLDQSNTDYTGQQSLW